MVELLNAANKARTALSGAITATATSFSVEDASSFPKPPFAITVEDEIMEVGTVSGNTFSNVTRGLEGTVAVAHEQGAPVENRFTAGTYNRMVDSFNEQKVKVIKVEQELNNFKTTLQQININQEAKQKVSGYDIITIPKNAANGQVSDVKIKGLTATNLIKNGNFEEGLNNWINYGVGSTGSIREESTEYAFLGNTSFKLVRSLGISDGYGKRQQINTIPNHKYYAYGWCYTPSAVDVNTPCAMIIEAPNTYSYFNLNLKDVWQRTSLEFIASLNSTTLILGSAVGSDKMAAGYFDGIVCIDLTSTFGAGNEPTKEQCDQIFTNWFDGTKSTLSAMRLKSVGKNIINLDEAKPNYRVNSIQFYDDRIVVYPSGLDCSIQIPFYMEAGKEYCGKLLPRGTMIFGDAVWFVNNINRISTISNYPLIPLINIKGVAIWYLDNREDLTPITIYKKDVMVALGTTVPEYEPYTESIQYLPNVGELRSLPYGTNDEVNVTEGKATIRIGHKTDVASGTVINYVDMADGGQYYAWNNDGETETGIKGDTLEIDATSLNYQLAEPIITPVQVSGTLVSYPSGTVYIERVVPDAGLYTDKMTVLHKDLPIKALERLSKIDYTTGLETELNVSQAVISSDKLSFTHPSLAKNDIVFFIYEYDRESTIPTTEIEYYDSRYVVKDKTTGKFYKWNIEVDNGVPNIVLTEV